MSPSCKENVGERFRSCWQGLTSLSFRGPWGGGLQPPPSRSTPKPLAKHPRSIPERSEGRAEGASPLP